MNLELYFIKQSTNIIIILMKDNELKGFVIPVRNFTMLH